MPHMCLAPKHTLNREMVFGSSASGDGLVEVYENFLLSHLFLSLFSHAAKGSLSQVLTQHLRKLLSQSKPPPGRRRRVAENVKGEQQMLIWETTAPAPSQRSC